MRYILRIIFVLLFFIVLPAFFTAEAAYLKFDKTTVTSASGATFQISVMVEPGSDGLSSTDVYLKYDATLLKANSVAAGTQFPIVTNDIATSGTIYIAGMVSDPASSVSTVGTLATVTFQALKDGAETLSFDCNSSKIVKNDFNATNTIACSQNETSSVTIGSGSSSGTTSTDTTTDNTDTASNTVDTENNDSSSIPSELPKSGVFDNVIKFVLPGTILLIFGSMLRLVL